MTKGAFNEVGEISREAWDTLTGSEPTYSYCDRVKKLEAKLQEKDREIAELMEKQELHWEHVTGLLAWQETFMNHEMKSKAMEDRDIEIEAVKMGIHRLETVKIKKLMDNIAVLNESIKDLRDFKSKFMDFKSQCSCSQFRDFWPWE